jgi:acyl-CoA synthetase (AMP-forming)/AMP-acid ligase II
VLGQWLNRLPPGHIVVHRPDGAVTAAKLAGQAAAIAEALRAPRGEPAADVLLYCEDAGHFLAGLIGALAAGRHVLLPAHAAPDYLAEIHRAGAVLLTDVPGLPGTGLLLTGMAEVRPALSLASTGGTLSFFTSGSTGQPKLVTKALAQLTAEVEVLIQLWGTPHGPVVGTVSHQHIYGLLFRVLWPLAAGGIIHGPRIDNWESLVPLLAPASVLVASPAHLTRLPDSFAGAARPRHVFSSGAPLPAAAAGVIARRLGMWPIEVLGSTETGGIAWRRQMLPDCPWTPFPGLELRAVADVDETAAGLLEVRSPFTGDPGFVAVGDRARFLADGRFSLDGRADRIVKIEGKRVSLPRIEQALLALPGVAQAAAVDLVARKGALAAVVVLDEAGAAALARMGPFRYSRSLRRSLAMRLESMERPKFWRFVARLPENAQGKRTMAALRALFEVRETPVVVTRDVAADHARFEFDLDLSLRWFDGHFPDRPILPGVAQIHLAAVFAEEAWGVRFVGSEMSRVKFRRVIEPATRVSLVLTRPAPDRLDFQYIANGEVASSGTLRGTT